MPNSLPTGRSISNPPRNDSTSIGFPLLIQTPPKDFGHEAQSSPCKSFLHAGVPPLVPFGPCLPLFGKACRRRGEFPRGLCPQFIHIMNDPQSVTTLGKMKGGCVASALCERSCEFQRHRLFRVRLLLGPVFGCKHSWLDAPTSSGDRVSQQIA